MYSLLLALIYLAFISLGLPDSLLGSGWPVMHAELGVPVSYMGVVSMVISGGTIVSSLLSEKQTVRRMDDGFGRSVITTLIPARQSRSAMPEAMSPAPFIITSIVCSP